MNDVIEFSSKEIDVKKLRAGVTKLSAEVIMPAKEDTYCELAPEHAADPIKNLEDINNIVDYLLQNNRYRDYMMFVVGINFGLRASDLRMLRFSNIINDNLTFKDRFPVFEKKTRNTRKRKKNRYVTINKAVIDAVTTYLNHSSGVSLSDYMFMTEATNGKDFKEPLSVRSMNRILKGIANDLDMNIHMSTHTLRKTFCYHQMLMSNNDNRKLLLLQKMLNHSSPMQTLDYIGISQDEIADAYKNLNLGCGYSYMEGSNIFEFDCNVI